MGTPTIDIKPSINRWIFITLWWNSTLEAVCIRVPILAWPIRGDQILNAKLMGMVKIMSDEEVHKNAAILCSKFCYGFPSSSNFAYDAFTSFIEQSLVEN